MNILVINATTDLYGANRILAQVMEILGEKNKLILVVPQEGPLCEHLRARNVNVEFVFEQELPHIGRDMSTIPGMLRTLRKFSKSYFTLKKIIKQHNCTLAYVNTLSCVMNLRLLKWIGIKTVAHVHEILEQPKLFTDIINKSALNWADHIICVSAPVYENLLLHAPDQKRKNKLTTILNGIGDAFKETAYVEKPAAEKLTVCLIGRIKPEKGIWFFLDAIDQLSPEIAAKAVFQIVGGPAPGGDHHIVKLNESIAANKFGSSITYIPFTIDVKGLQAASDIQVVPSLMRDPFPTTILEGLSAGKPVIATNTGGAIQSVVHGETGFLINADDVAAFKQYLELLITDDTLRKKMGHNARQYFEQHFTLEIFRRNILHYLETVL
jgi:glycosyltransferase involved in cell wall biosynthesis